MAVNESFEKELTTEKVTDITLDYEDSSKLETDSTVDLYKTGKQNKNFYERVSEVIGAVFKSSNFIFDFIFDKIKARCLKSITFLEFVIVFYTSLILFSIIMITVGVIHLKNCQIQKLIPIWLIVCGFLNLLLLVPLIKISINFFNG
jgi:hypothetical protein